MNAVRRGTLGRAGPSSERLAATQRHMRSAAAPPRAGRWSSGRRSPQWRHHPRRQPHRATCARSS